MSRLTAAAVATLLLVGGSAAWAQAAKREAPKAETGAKAAMPSAEQLAILIQTAVVATSQANLTGNYSVLHALAAPGFQQANPPEKLAQVFAQWRANRIDLTPIIIYSPILRAAPVIDDKNMLQLSGYYRTAPQQVHFDLMFQPVGGQWRLFGINLSTQPAQVAGAEGAPPAPGGAPALKKAAPPAGKK